MDELPIACDRAGLDSEEPKRQRELWRSLLADVEERRELEEGYSLRFPAARLADVTELMGIERRCCGFLELQVVSEAGAESHIWFTLSGPSGSKRVLDAELGLMVDSTQRNP